MSNIKGHVAELLKIISEGLWEKEHIISLGLLSFGMKYGKQVLEYGRSS